MLIGALGPRISNLLEEVNAESDFSLSLVCTDAGLLIAAAGDGADEDQLAGLTSLFDDIVVRANRDVGLGTIDEVTLLDPVWGRCVVRPLPIEADFGRLFLVVRVGPKNTWRRYSNKLRREIAQMFEER